MNILDIRWNLPAEHAEINEQLDALLHLWEGTPYFEGQQVRGYGVDCFRFVCAILDSMEGRRTPFGHIPADRAMHDREGAVAAVREVLGMYKPYQTVTDGLVEPGDVFIVGVAGGGPGHAMIAGVQPSTLWHVSGPRKRVCRTGIGINGELHRIYRIQDKINRWSR